MKPIVLGMALAGGLLWTGCAQAGNAAHGKAIFADQCASCHSATPGQNGIGPSLAGIYGKPAASTAGFNFSPALKAAHIVWNDAALDKFLANPQGDVTGSKMPYMGMPDAADRADVIAYLASLKAR
ncbi:MULTISPECIES: c-type cytochrome [Acidiphilium]|uniref:Cytochrome c n=1 Tax=Acidiphilium rubrum TaxID=526 RepID=A0A8G2CLF3_ACIRU|nr:MULTISPECIES: c-type cytochrome [Acidiphilium]SIQ99963.1 cytochrome c [Acidiphilium rubrum]